MIEREGVLGGSIRTEALIRPGFRHDGLSAAQPLFVAGPAPAALGPALHAAGFEYRNSASPAGGASRTGADVVQVLVDDASARGVALADGCRLYVRDVICNLTPTQLYGRLLAPFEVPREVAAQARAGRYGKGNMPIHLALSEPPHWPAAERSDVLYVHPGAGPGCRLARGDRGRTGHAACRRHLWHIGASTHPGPGLGGLSGFHVARRLGAR